MGGTHEKFQDMHGLAEVARALEQENVPATDAAQEKPSKSRKKKKVKDLVVAEDEDEAGGSGVARKDLKKEKKRKKIESRTKGERDDGLSDDNIDDDGQDADAAGKGKKAGAKKESKKRKKKEKVAAVGETSGEDVDQEMEQVPSEPESDEGNEFSEWIETSERGDDATFKDIYRRMFNSAFGSELASEEDIFMKALMNKSVEVFAEDMSAPFKKLAVESMRSMQSKRGDKPSADIGRLPFESAYSWL
ncbi:hypothetical protein BSKO_11530 [Bryopsis sp. KO-2023]|nr:hypothetical protein BSKO_11530 [Bryopsis sp. KO-2023]